MTMASAPRGTGPPVAIGVAVPDSTGRVGAVPQAITSPLSRRRTGVASPAAARSAERTAKPSTLERSNGGTSIGATISAPARSRAHRQAAASRSGRRAETTRPRTAPARLRATEWSGTGPDRRCRGFSAESCGHFGTHVSPATYRHRPACPQQIPHCRRGPPARRRRGRWSAATVRRPQAAASLFGPSRAARFQRCRRCDAILRASGRRDRPPRRTSGQTVEHGQRQHPPRRERLIRRARQRDDGDFSDPADRRGPAGLQRDAMRDDVAARGPMPRSSHRCGRRRCRRWSGADRSRRPSSGGGNGRRIASRGLAADDFGAGRARRFPR